MEDNLVAHDNVEKHRFEIDLGGALALAEYRIDSDSITFTHTEVPSAHEGRGIGTILIRAGLDAARQRGLKVVPACPFFERYMENHPETLDLIDPSFSSLN